MMTRLRLWSKEWFDWKTAKSNFQIKNELFHILHIISDHGLQIHGSFQWCPTNAPSNQNKSDEFQRALKVRSNFQTIFRQIFEAPKAPPS